MISSRKVGGILAELVPMSDDSHAMIIGIGLNLDVPEDVLLAGISREGRWAPGSIKQQTGVSLPRETVWEKISEIFLSKLSDFFSGRNIDLRPINEKQFMYGSQIRFRSSPDVPPIQGIHRGIDHLTGGIVMEQDGVVKTFHSGEIFELNS
jgi:biotin-(acetyl-CoA carboxylase) ligase